MGILYTYRTPICVQASHMALLIKQYNNNNNNMSMHICIQVKYAEDKSSCCTVYTTMILLAENCLSLLIHWEVYTSQLLSPFIISSSFSVSIISCCFHTHTYNNVYSHYNSTSHNMVSSGNWHIQSVTNTCNRNM